MRPRAAVPLVAVLAACSHSWPFSAGSYAVGPRTSGQAIQLTYNPGDDYGAVWLPDGSDFMYTTQRRDRPDHDQCLATMPAQGGTIVSEFCNRAAAADDSTNVFFSAAVSATQRIAYGRASSYYLLGPLAPHYLELVAAPLDDPGQATVLKSFPYLSPSGRSHDSFDYLRWLSDTSLVYVGQRLDYPRACSSCPPDTVRTGLEIIRLDLGGAQPVMTVLPGTDNATSLAVNSPDTVYFTLAGDTRVYRLALDSDSLMVAHDFGSGFPLGIQVEGSRLVAVVSGQLEVVDLSTGVVTLVGAMTGLAHPALQPGGSVLVADFTTGDGTTDLWRVALP